MLKVRDHATLFRVSGFVRTVSHELGYGTLNGCNVQWRVTDPQKYGTTDHLYPVFGVRHYAMGPVNKAQLQIADVLWMNTPALTLAEFQSKQLTVCFLISQRGSVNRFQVWDGLEMLTETASLETAIDCYNAIQLQPL